MPSLRVVELAVTKPKHPGGKSPKPGLLQPLNRTMELHQERDQAVRKRLVRDSRLRLKIGGNRL